ncbi:zinc ribbon domain-containing protein [candidate division KSB1 bacterium]|nr:zinc ribbon domain-containing protein [candidate division KSB1 bacterium]
MPTYEYKCVDCGYFFEEFQSINADPLTTCPECGGRVKRLIGVGNGFLFKGSGFYITDYRNDTYKKDKEKSEKPGPATSSKSDDNTLSKKDKTTGNVT